MNSLAQTEWESCRAVVLWERLVKFSRLPLYNGGYDIKYLLMFLPAAGNRNNNTGRLNNRGNNGNYWSSSENSSKNAWNLNFNRGNVDTDNNNRTNGLSLRCISAFNMS